LSAVNHSLSQGEGNRLRNSGEKVKIIAVKPLVEETDYYEIYEIWRLDYNVKLKEINSYYHVI
jgi:hypothetical protein